MLDNQISAACSCTGPALEAEEPRRNAEALGGDNAGVDPEETAMFGGATWIARRELEQLRFHLGDPHVQGVLILGAGGAGKTVLLRMAGRELKRDGRTVVYVNLRDTQEPSDLAHHLLDAAAEWSPQVSSELRRTVRTSAGSTSVQETVPLLRRVSAGLTPPTVLLDSLDEAIHPTRMAAVIDELSLALDDWKFVVASRLAAASRIGHLTRFAVIELRGLNHEEALHLLALAAPELSESDSARLVQQAGATPMALQMLAQLARDSVAFTDAGEVPSLREIWQRVMRGFIEASSDPQTLQQLLNQLALAGGREQTSVLASRLRLPSDEVVRILSAGPLNNFLVLDDAARTVAFVHGVISDFIVEDRVRRHPFALTDLEFGAEEAEKDALLAKSLVRRRELESALGQRKSLVVGDRGSGKSAIFKLIATRYAAAVTHDPVHICPVSNAGDLVHRVVVEDAWSNADTLRAAWLVAIASVAAGSIPASGPKQLRRDANSLRAAVGLPVTPTNLGTRLLRAAVRPFVGTTLRFAVGPINLEAQLPSGSAAAHTRASIDVESFLEDLDKFLSQCGSRTLVMFDRIDETYKYDRAKQETFIQALLQAESRVSTCRSIALLLFLRTDLFELHDIQEKNKLVSRTLNLRWSEEEWLELFVRRAVANVPLQHITEPIVIDHSGADISSALRLLVPAVIEGQPADRWLTDSLRNGNGDVSPRLAVLLLYLARDRSARPREIVETLPLFSVEALTSAMTALSELSFSEVVNDFKVAPTFVLNCRAAKLDRFRLQEVGDLFDEAEGKKGDQVRLLERLGFLERTVQVEAAGSWSEFRIPRLYTRCWEHA